MATLERVAALELLVLALKRSLVSVANRTVALKKLTGYLDGDHRRALLGIHQRVVNLACAPKVHRKVRVCVQSAADIHVKPWWNRQTMVELPLCLRLRQVFVRLLASGWTGPKQLVGRNHNWRARLLLGLVASQRKRTDGRSKLRVGLSREPSII